MVQNAEKKANNVVYPCINPTSYTRNLHPILHPKSLVNTGYLLPWCRKCRTFSKTFFIEGREEVVRKLKTAGFFGNKRQRSGSVKTLEFFGQKYGCFTSKVRMFYLKSTDVFECSWNTPCFPVRVLFLPPTKKVFGKYPTFPTPSTETSCICLQFRVKVWV